jgi:hypothetical protein
MGANLSYHQLREAVKKTWAAVAIRQLNNLLCLIECKLSSTWRHVSKFLVESNKTALNLNPCQVLALVLHAGVGEHVTAGVRSRRRRRLFLSPIRCYVPDQYVLHIPYPALRLRPTTYRFHRTAPSAATPFPDVQERSRRETTV